MKAIHWPTGRGKWYRERSSSFICQVSQFRISLGFLVIFGSEIALPFSLMHRLIHSINTRCRGWKLTQHSLASADIHAVPFWWTHFRIYHFRPAEYTKWHVGHESKWRIQENPGAEVRCMWPPTKNDSQAADSCRRVYQTEAVHTYRPHKSQTITWCSARILSLPKTCAYHSME